MGANTTQFCALIRTPQRLDVLLAGVFAEHSRSQTGKWIAEGAVEVDGKLMQKSAYLVQAKQIISCKTPEHAPTNVLPNTELDCPVLFENASCIVVNKPLGMLTHPTADPASFHTSVASWLSARLDGKKDAPTLGARPGIVHRLDKWTSGALLLAKSDAAMRWYAEAFEQRSTTKIYLALVCGRLPYPKGRIDSPIGRDQVRRIAMAVTSLGKNAISEYTVLAEGKLGSETVSLVRVHIHTGRTHQIRVHFASIGHPLVGDEVYFTRITHTLLRGQWLHAAHLEIPDMDTKKLLVVDAPLPPVFTEILREASIEVPTI